MVVLVVLATRIWLTMKEHPQQQQKEQEQR
jgi:hypothetical protein